MITNEVSLVRLYAMRGLYLLNLVLVGAGVWVEFMHRQKPWDPMVGAAFSFWAALAALSGLGIRYPLAMLPLLFLQLFYKTFWVFVVYPPLRAVESPTDMMQTFAIAILLDIIVIPWTYVLAHYVRQPSERWR